MKRTALILTMFLSGCASIGPSQINIDRNRYNESIQTTQNQELLYNIVRIRYAEPVSFLQITNVTASYTFTPSGSGNLGWTWLTGNGATSTATTKNVSLTPSVSYSDIPTISYVPINSSDYINELYSPTQLSNLSYLLHGGSLDPDLFFRVVIQSAHHYENAIQLSQGRMTSIPVYKEYYKLVHLIEEALRKGIVRLESTEYMGVTTLQLHFKKADNTSRLAVQIKRMFRVPIQERNIIFYDRESDQANVVYIETRSVIGIMNYFAHGIHMPDCEVAPGGRAIPNQLKTGEKIDVRELLHGTLQIYATADEPDSEEAFVKTKLHGKWFYVKANDIDSKIAFDFINSLIILTAGYQPNNAQTGPVLTVPTR